MIPTPTGERIQLLDVLRGFAIFGMFAVNMTWDLRGGQIYLPEPLGFADQTVMLFIALLVCWAPNPALSPGTVSETKLSATENGRLFLGVNDRVYLHPEDHHYVQGESHQVHAGCYADNKGEFSVRIRVKDL